MKRMKLCPYRYVNKGDWNIDLGRNFDPISDLNSEMYMMIPISIIKPK